VTPRVWPLSESTFNYMSLYIGHPPVNAVAAKRQACLLDPKEVKDGSVQVVIFELRAGRPVEKNASAQKNVLACASQPVYISSQRVSY
jgi:hypothetical protein